MHGVVFSELQKFVTKNHGHTAWSKLLEKAGFAHKVYVAAGQYADSEIARLVATASEMTGKSPTQILEAFGEFIVPSLLKLYGHLLKPGWKSLEVIDNTEGTVHSVVRLNDRDALPPHLRTRRAAADEVILVYDSPRKMCALAIGIGRGVAKHFNETLLIRQNKCMHKGDPICEISYKKTD